MTTGNTRSGSIALGNDEAAADLRHILVEHLEHRGLRVDTFGAETISDAVDYPDVAVHVASKVAGGVYDRALLLCGTGIGMAIAANKVPGVRAAQAADTYSAERARKSNDAQVLCIGSRTVGPELAKAIVDKWLESEYEPESRSQPKVDKLIALDAKVPAS